MRKAPDEGPSPKRESFTRPPAYRLPATSPGGTFGLAQHASSPRPPESGGQRDPKVSREGRFRLNIITGMRLGNPLSRDFDSAAIAASSHHAVPLTQGDVTLYLCKGPSPGGRGTKTRESFRPGRPPVIVTTR